MLKKEVEEIDVRVLGDLLTWLFSFEKLIFLWKVELGMSRRQLDALHALMTETQGGLSGVMGRLKEVSKTASSRHIFYLVLFIVSILFFLFYFLRK
jgi:hypothetical protein